MTHIFFRNRIYRQITINGWVSALGDTLFYLAFMNHVSSYDFAPQAIFWISLSETLPTILSFFIGSLADFQTQRIKKSLVISATKVILYSLATVILMGWDFSLLVVFLVCLINLLSDSLSSFGGSMTGPIYMKVIAEDMTEALGFGQATRSVVSIMGNVIGAILLGFISIQALSVLNVLTFVFAFVGVLTIRRGMESFEKELVVQEQFNWDNYKSHMLTSIQQLLGMTTLVRVILTSIVDNVVINSTMSIIVLLLIKQPLLGLTTGQTFSIYTSLFMVAMIAGNFLTGRILEKVSLKTFILWSQALAYLILLGYVTNQVLLVAGSAIACAFVNGLMTPRLHSSIWKQIPEGSMGAIQSAISMVDVVLPGLLTMLAVWLATSLSLPSASLFLAVLLLASTVLTLKTKTY